MSALSTLKFWGSNDDAFDDVANGLAAIRGDHDAVALIPYDDGTFWLKGCSFDKELIGGQGGYETDDGDKIVLDGDGQPVRDLLGVSVVLAVDPTEHAAAVEPIKALVAQKNNIGEYIRVDREGNVLEIGPAIKSAAESAIFADPESDEHWSARALEYDTVRHRIESMGTDPDEASNELIERAVMQVEEEAAAQAQEADEGGKTAQDYLPWGDDIESDPVPAPEPIEIDLQESLVGDRLREMNINPETASDQAIHSAMKQLAEEGEIHKIYDIAPPAAPALDDGELVLEEATHVAVDQSKAADLVPKTTNTTELQTAIDKARNEEREEGKMKTTLIHGIIIGAVVMGVAALMFGGLFALL